MDAVFIALTLAFWGAMVLLVRGFEKLTPAQGARP